MDLLGMSTPSVHWTWLRRPTADSAGRGVHVRSMSVPTVPCLQEDSETADNEVRGAQQAYVDVRRMCDVRHLRGSSPRRQQEAGEEVRLDG